MKEVLNFILDNWETGVGLAAILYELLARLIPTEKNKSLLDFAFKILNAVVKNKRKPSDNDQVVGTKSELKNRVVVDRTKFIVSLVFLLTSLGSIAQTNGNFKAVRFVNVLDSTTVLPINATIYYNEQSGYLMAYENNVWKRLIGGGSGGGLLTASNGLQSIGTDVQLGGTLSEPTTEIFLAQNNIIFNGDFVNTQWIDSLVTPQFRQTIEEGGFSTGIVQSATQENYWLHFGAAGVLTGFDMYPGGDVSLLSSDGNTNASAINVNFDYIRLKNEDPLDVDNYTQFEIDKAGYYLQSGNGGLTPFTNIGASNSIIDMRTSDAGNVMSRFRLQNDGQILGNGLSYQLSIDNSSSYFALSVDDAEFNLGSGVGNVSWNSSAGLTNHNYTEPVLITSDGTMTLQPATGGSNNLVLDMNSVSGVLLVINGLPTSCAGLDTNTIASVGGVLTVCP